MSIRSSAYVRKLEEAGVDPKIARAHGEALEDLAMSDYVTKDYLDARLTAMESRTDARLHDLQTRIVQFESTIIKWIVGQAVAIVALLLTLERMHK